MVGVGSGRQADVGSAEPWVAKRRVPLSGQRSASHDDVALSWRREFGGELSVNGEWKGETGGETAHELGEVTLVSR